MKAMLFLVTLKLLKFGSASLKKRELLPELLKLVLKKTVINGVSILANAFFITMTAKTGGAVTVALQPRQLATHVVQTAKYFMILASKITIPNLVFRTQQVRAVVSWKSATKSLCNIAAMTMAAS